MVLNRSLLDISLILHLKITLAEVLCQVPPLRLRLEELLLMEYIRILRKGDNHPLRQLFIQLGDNFAFMATKQITHLHKMRALIREASKHRIHPDTIERRQLPSSSELALLTLSLDERPWHGLGNSRTRTDGQKKLARELISQGLEETGPRSLVAFTDGSALTNPGPCGAAAIIYTNGMNSQPIIRTESISSFSTSYHGELRALKLALAYVCTFSLNHWISEVRLFSDCQSALTSISSGKTCQNHTSTISEIRAHIRRLEEKNITTLGTWVCGHAELEPNELADKHAKLAAEKDRLFTSSFHIS